MCKLGNSLKQSENSLCSHFDWSDSTRQQFCTCHDSSTGVTCAKWWSNRIISLKKKPSKNLKKIWFMASRNFCEMEMNEMSDLFISRIYEKLLHYDFRLLISHRDFLLSLSNHDFWFTMIALFIWQPYSSIGNTKSWWRHQMETFSALLAICAGNSPVNGGFPTQRPVTRSFDVFCHLRLNKTVE